MKVVGKDDLDVDLFVVFVVCMKLVDKKFVV